jgi:hypothetical protein
MPPPVFNLIVKINLYRDKKETGRRSKFCEESTPKVSVIN